MGDEFVVQGAVAQHAVGGRRQDGLKDPVPAGQGAGGHTGLLAVEQGGAGADGGAGGLVSRIVFALLIGARRAFMPSETKPGWPA
jgi:hypothetical protein